MTSSPFVSNLSQVWINWHSATDANRSPSSLIGLIEGSYEAYCYDQCAWYLVTTVKNKVEKVGQKKAKGQASQEAAMTNRLKKLLGQSQDKASKGQFADPAALFGKAQQQ